jgi:hypothetical protein
MDLFPIADSTGESNFHGLKQICIQRKAEAGMHQQTSAGTKLHSNLNSSRHFHVSNSPISGKL